MKRRRPSLRHLGAAAALTPTAGAAAASAFRTLAEVASRGSTAYPFLAGLLAYPVVHYSMLRPVRLYVLGHELTHGMAAVLSGARVRKMKVSRDGGHVVLDRSNAFIALAPYWIPLYTLLWMTVVRLTSLWRPVPGWVLAAGIGASLAFHILLTIDTLWGEHQSDLDHGGGTFFSLVVILLGNSVVLVGALKALYPNAVSLHGYASAVGAQTHLFWREAAALARIAGVWALDQVKS